MARALARVGGALVRDDLVEEADAVVVLGGAPQWRTPAAVRLWAAGVAPRVVAVGGARGFLEARRTVAALRRRGLPDDAILLVERDAPGTWDEARVVAGLAADAGWAALIVVTSPYHTRRAGHFVEVALRRAGVVATVAVVPAPEDPWRPDAWWRDPQHRRLARNEVLKYLSWRSGARAAWVRAGRPPLP